MSHADFVALRHWSPECVLTLRAALDVGTTPSELKAIVRKEAKRRASEPQYVGIAERCIDYMATDSRIGRVEWGNGSYRFVDHQPQDGGS